MQVHAVYVCIAKGFIVFCAQPSCSLLVLHLTKSLTHSVHIPYSKKPWRIWQIAFNLPKFFLPIILDDHMSTLSN